MNKQNDIIINALRYYDKNQEQYFDLYNRFKHWTLHKNDKDMEHNKITFFDKNNKQIFESEYETLGVYYNKSNLWVWSWTIPYIRKNLIYISKRILNHVLDFDDFENESTFFIKSEFLSSKFIVSDPVQLDLHVAIASYIGKQKFVYGLRYSYEYGSMEEEKPSHIPDKTEPIDIIYYIYLLNTDIPNL